MGPEISSVYVLQMLSGDIIMTVIWSKSDLKYILKLFTMKIDSRHTSTGI